MRIGIPRSAVALLALAVTFSVAPPTTAAAPDPAKSARSLSATVALAADGPGARQAVNLEEAQLRIDVTAKELRFARDRSQRLDRDLAVANSVTEELQGELNVVAQATLKNAIDGYRLSEIPRGLLGGRDLTSSLRADALVGAAVSADTEAFDAYRDLRKDFEIEQSELADKEDRAIEAAADVDRLEERLDGELAVYTRLEEKRLAAEASAAVVQASNRAQARGRKVGFYLDTCPVDGPHEFIDSWGFARSGGRRHKGVDVLAPIGTPIVAPVSGRVEHFSNSVGGRSFRLFTEDGNYFYGTHLSAFGTQGEVRAGEVIGFVGDDGNARGIPHLHFEIHPGGRGNPINPYIDTAAVCAGAL